MGLRPGDRVAILLPTRPEFVTAFFAGSKIGAIPAPISYAVTPQEQAFLLADSGAHALVTTTALWEPLRGCGAGFPLLRHALFVGESEPPAGEQSFSELTDAAPTALDAAATSCDDV